MDIECYELLGALQAVMIERKGKISYFICELDNENLVLDSLHMVMYDHVKYFYYKDNYGKIYRIVSTQRTPAGCKRYYVSRENRNSRAIDLDRNLLLNMLHVGTVILPMAINEEGLEVRMSKDGKYSEQTLH